MTAAAAIAHFLLWFGRNLYPSPEDAAQALISRLDREGYRIVRNDYPKPEKTHG